ncbi:tail fiber assembly protein [Pseudomonas koreensis]|uniref:tail fiber assembly protein n=1 Tax=Pseudomonas koreensis TaxID=198620 RepID=UPI00380027EB
MNRYVYIGYRYTTSFPVVIQILDTEQGLPTTPVEGVSGTWIDATGNTTVQVGWKAVESWDNGFSVFNFVELTYEDYLVIAPVRIRMQQEDAIQWLVSNPLQYKKDLEIATPAEEAALLSYKQYFIALSEIKSQSGYPAAINWPVAPF